MSWDLWRKSLSHRSVSHIAPAFRKSRKANRSKKRPQYVKEKEPAQGSLRNEDTEYFSNMYTDWAGMEMNNDGAKVSQDRGGGRQSYRTRHSPRRKVYTCMVGNYGLSGPLWIETHGDYAGDSEDEEDSLYSDSQFKAQVHPTGSKTRRGASEGAPRKGVWLPPEDDDYSMIPLVQDLLWEQGEVREAGKAKGEKPSLVPHHVERKKRREEPFPYNPRDQDDRDIKGPLSFVKKGAKQPSKHLSRILPFYDPELEEELNQKVLKAATWGHLKRLYDNRLYDPRGDIGDLDPRQLLQILVRLGQVVGGPHTVGGDRASYEEFVKSLCDELLDHYVVFKPQELVSIVHVLATIQYKHQDVLEVVTTALGPGLKSLESKDLMRVIRGLSDLGFNPGVSWMAEFMKASQNKLAGFKPSPLVKTINALVEFQCSPTSGWKGTFIIATFSQLPEFTCYECVSTISAMAALEFVLSSRHLNALEEFLSAHIQTFRVPELTRSITFFRHYKHRPSESWLQAYIEQATSLARRLSSQQVADLVHSFVTLDYRPPEASLVALLEAQAPRMMQLSARALIETSQAVVSFKYPAPPYWLDVWVRCLKKRWPKMTPEQQLGAVSAMRRLDTEKEYKEVARVLKMNSLAGQQQQSTPSPT